jgi:hypothetical protein
VRMRAKLRQCRTDAGGVPYGRPATTTLRTFSSKSARADVSPFAHAPHAQRSRCADLRARTSCSS